MASDLCVATVREVEKVEGGIEGECNESWIYSAITVEELCHRIEGSCVLHVL